MKIPVDISDPAIITRHLRAKASSHLLVCAVHHLNVFEQFINGPQSIEDLKQSVNLRDRPAMVLFPALCAMDLLTYSPEGKLDITETGRFLTKSHPASLIGYVGLDKEDPGVLRMNSWLKNDGPQDAAQGLSYIKDEHAVSPMDDPEPARFFTMALAGRAKLLSPLVAKKMTGRKGHLLDVAGGTGYYSYEWLLANPKSTATIFDRPEVLKVATEILEEYCKEKGVVELKQRIHFVPGDMLSDDLPEADLLLAASLFHDWPEETCEKLAKKFAAIIPPGGEIWIHDSFLDDTMDGPLAVTDYSAMLFLGTKGRAYSKKEYRRWLIDAGLVCGAEYIPTMLDYGLIRASKP